MSSTLTPVVAVTTDVFFHRIYDWHATPSTYLEAVFEGSGVIPLLVPSLGEPLDPEALLTRVDGLFLTGAKSNVYPKTYGKSPSIDHEPYDHERDATSLPLIRKAIEMGVPVLAICRGLQELNVAFGGTLNTEIQANEGIQDHRGQDWSDNDQLFKLAHSVKFMQDSCFEKIFDATEIVVNSVHRQAIGRLGSGLQVEATAQDGTVEAVTAPDTPGFVMGVQWHPEYLYRSDDASARIFQAFGDAVRNYAGQSKSYSTAAE